MFKPIPNSKVRVSVTAGEVPSLTDVTENGAYINSADLKLYYMKDAGVITERSITLPFIASLAGIEAGIAGRIEVKHSTPLTGSFVSSDDIGTIVNAGDMLSLPYGKLATVSFVVNDNMVTVEELLEERTYEYALVSRHAATGSSLSNPTELTLLWDEIVSSTIPLPPEPLGAYSQALGHWRFNDSTSATTDLVSEQSITIDGESPVYTENALTLSPTNPFVELPYSEGVDPSETISIVLRNRGTDVSVLMGTLHSSGDGIGYGLYVNEAGPDGTASLSINSRGGYRAGELYNLPLGEWVNLILTRKMTATSETFTLMANGVIVWFKEELIDVGGYQTSNMPYCVGDAYYNREEGIDYDIADIAFFEGFASDERLAEIYADVKAGMTEVGITLP